MSIDFTGHCAYPIAETQRRIAFARRTHPEWFDTILLLYDARDLGRFGLEIAREFGIEAKCCFLMSVNDKEGLDQVRDAVEFVYEVFGTHDLVVTWGNDSVRPPLRHYPPMTIG
jgi:hypothetical protein